LEERTLDVGWFLLTWRPPWTNAKLFPWQVVQALRDICRTEQDTCKNLSCNLLAGCAQFCMTRHDKNTAQITLFCVLSPRHRIVYKAFIYALHRWFFTWNQWRT
jgi:hypothetical protein